MKRFISIFLSICMIALSVVPAVAADKKSPKVVSSTPKGKQSNVQTNITLKIKFSEVIKKGKTFSKIGLYSGSKRVFIKIGVKSNYISVDPKRNLRLGTKYTFKIPAKAVKDKAGNSLGKEFKLLFTTRKASKPNPTAKPATPTPVATATPTATPTAALTATPTATPVPTPTPTPTPTDPRIMVPQIDGNWWRITDDDPDISPWTIPDNQSSNVCDFTIYQSEDQKWHVVACVRGTNNPHSTRLFAHWESDSITKADWTEKGVFAIGAEIGTPADNPSSVRGLQAPHCIKKDGKYYMFYNSEGAYCITSEDGTNWKTDGEWNRLTTSAGSKKIFDMGRDVMLLDNTERDGKYYGYFTGKATGASTDTFTYRTSTDLAGPWSTTALTAKAEGNPESPFMLYKNGYYYLWQQSVVYVSDTPTSFGNTPVTNMWEFKYAPEIIEYNGEYYAAAYSGGLHIAKIKWVEVGESIPNLYSHYVTNGTVGIAYKATLRAKMGDGELEWTVTGSLPDGLALNKTYGHEIFLEGTPTKAGTYSFKLTVTDDDGQSHSVDKTIIIS